MSIKSLRFNPFWDENSSYQKDGLIDLINFIKIKNDKLSTWLEVGSYIGESAEIFLSFDFIQKLFCIDVWEASLDRKYLMAFGSKSDQKIIKETFYKNLKDYIEIGRCVPIEGTSQQIFKKIAQKFDVIYIDAEHRYNNVLIDLFIWYTKLNVGGYMCGHDFIIDKRNSLHGCAKAIQDFMSFVTPYAGTYEFHVFKDGSWLFKKEQDITDLEEYKKKFKLMFKNK